MPSDNEGIIKWNRVEFSAASMETQEKPYENQISLESVRTSNFLNFIVRNLTGDCAVRGAVIRLHLSALRMVWNAETV